MQFQNRIPTKLLKRQSSPHQATPPSYAIRNDPTIHLLHIWVTRSLVGHLFVRFGIEKYFKKRIDDKQLMKTKHVLIRIVFA